MTPRPRSKGHAAEVSLFGTPAELEYLRVRAEAAIAQDPAQARVLGRILAAFVRDTAAARARVLATPPSWDEREPVPPTRPESARITGVTRYATLTLTLLGAITAVAVLLPSKKYFAEPDPGVAVWVSVIAAVVVVAAAAVGALLPPYDSFALAPAQNWQIYYFSAAVLGVGVAIQGFDATGDREAVAPDLWSALLATNLLALVTTLAAAERLRRRTTTLPVVVDQPDADSEDAYFTAIRPWKKRALVEVGALAEASPGSSDRVDENWQEAVNEGRRTGQLSDRAAARVRDIPPHRLLLELLAEPDLGLGD